MKSSPAAYALMLCIGLAIASMARPDSVKAAVVIAGAPKHFNWAGCGAHLQCARVRVPLDWSNPNGRKITLAVIRYRASRPAQRIGSLFFNPGGPGLSGVAAVAQRGGDLESLVGGRFDVVGWDPRGVGASTAVHCFNSGAARARFFGRQSVPTTAAASPHYIASVITFARQCGELNGEILAHISSVDTARDLDHLRGLAGDAQLTYLGESYGSFLGQTYANMFPHRVRAMAFDGVVDPIAYTTGDEVGLSKTMASTDLVFRKFEALCQAAGPSRCALAGKGSVATRVTQLLATLQHASTPARAAKATGRLSYANALTIIYSRIGNPTAWPELAELLNKAANGDGSAISRRAQIIYNALPAVLPPAIAIGCADSPAQQSTQAWPNVINRLTRVSRFYGPLLSWWLWAPCAAWPARSIYRYSGPWNVSGSQILVIGTLFDPNTPFENARRVARLLNDAVLLTHQGYGHVSVSDPSACVRRVTVKFLVYLVRPPRGSVCTSDRVPFDPNFGKQVPTRRPRLRD